MNELPDPSSASAEIQRLREENQQLELANKYLLGDRVNAEDRALKAAAEVVALRRQLERLIEKWEGQARALRVDRDETYNKGTPEYDIGTTAAEAINSCAAELDELREAVRRPPEAR